MSARPSASGPCLSPVREAVVLPLLLLTVVLLAGVRVQSDGRLRFVGPTVIALVLGTMLSATFVSAGLVSPSRLVAYGRSPAALVNGAILLLVLFLASSQVFTLLTPETGLAHFAFNAFFVALLGTVAAAQPGLVRLQASLLVMFSAALVLRFVVLNGLGAPGGSIARRLLTGALEGLTLGGLGLDYFAPVTGYVAFAALGLFFVALWLLSPQANAPSVTSAGDLT